MLDLFGKLGTPGKRINAANPKVTPKTIWKLR